ncbi:hypothetical protein FHS97_000562 [Sphingomonas endophytica]|uniref:Uncharacterized protein n=1 Tax=Sphingomonas endophytica TaxID=869719 RepID=A0ABR6N1K6_9SPHN|nr:hypothetical protein [Sphingomonas endophytica]
MLGTAALVGVAILRKRVDCLPHGVAPRCGHVDACRPPAAHPGARRRDARVP